MLDQRTGAQIREHYEIEKELANRLRRSSREERKLLYGQAYDELFRKVPHHPQLAAKHGQEAGESRARQEWAFLSSFVQPDMTFLEIGPGDCALTMVASRHVRRVVALDVSCEISRRDDFPANVELVIADGCDVPLPSGSVDVAYSNQLLEHLHPDDAIDHLKSVSKVLAPGGKYVCCTPNRVGGPHDVSRRFDAVATGFHLKEYTVAELRGLFLRQGFAKASCHLRNPRLSLRAPYALLLSLEGLVGALPDDLRKRVSAMRGMRTLMSIVMIGEKGSGPDAGVRSAAANRA